MNDIKPMVAEPWLRGTHSEVPAVPRAVLHALELAKEDIWKWCFPLTDEQLHHQSGRIAPIAFHLRHIARSLDRLLTYAEGSSLNETQLSLLKSEQEEAAKHSELFGELESALYRGAQRVRTLAACDFEIRRVVGEKQLTTTIGGLLVHIADHTQRHVGQAIASAQFVTKR